MNLITSSAQVLKKAFYGLIAIVLIIAIMPRGMATAVGPNLINNPSVETAASATTPTDWLNNAWGTNKATFEYLNTGARTGSRSVKTTLTSYTDGDAKWYFKPVAVAANTKYTYATNYKSNIASEVVVQFTSSTNVESYLWLNSPAASSSAWKAASYDFTTPANVSKATVFHVIAKVGWLQVDDVSLGTTGTSNPILAPTVSLTAPTANTTVKGSVNISATAASSGSSVAGVQFKVNGANVGNEVTAAPYTYSWDTTKVTNGSYSLTAVVRSTNGLSTTSTARTVTVSNPIAPTVSITAPIANASVAGITTIKATAASSGSTVAGVQFKVNGTNAGAEDTTVAYSYNWDTTKIANGSYQLTAVARSANGLTTTSVPVTVVVNNLVPVAPTVSITAPTTGTVSKTVAITATAASSGSSVAGVQFKINGDNAGTEDVTAPYSYSWDTTKVADGTYTITAVARSTNGLSTTSSSVVVTVSNPIAPTVSITAPTANATVSGSVNIDASAASSGSSVAGVQFKLDGTNLGSEDVTAPYSLAWDTTQIANGSHALTAVVRSANGLTTTSAAVTVNVNNVVVTPPVDTENLIANNSAETTDPTNNARPQNWQSNAWGTNTPVFTYATSGRTGSRSLTATINSYTDGDAKWFFDPVAVTSGKTYLYRDYYKATVASRVVVAYIDASGNYSYQEIDGAAAAADWTLYQAIITVPATAVKVTVFHLIDKVGSLSLDDSLLQVYAPSGTTDVIPNSSFETGTTTPTGWTGNSWGNNTANFQYISGDGYTGSRSAKVTVSNYVDGDAKWFFEPIKTLTPGKQYRFSVNYKGSAQAHPVVYFQKADGTEQYFGMPVPFAASTTTWQSYSDTFSVPTDAVSASVFMYIASNGWLQTDNYQISDYHSNGFNRPLLTLTFDDGHEDNATTALPLLNQYGFKTTQCFATTFIEGNPTAVADVLKFKNSGHEICSHTVTHPMLTTTDDATLDYELKHSKEYLESITGQPILNFATPYGDYDARVNAAIQKYYQAHRTVDEGYNSKDNFNQYRLRVQNILDTTSANQVASWIAQAQADNTWLVLVYHRVASNPGPYDSYTTDFAQQLAAIQASGITVKTYQDALTEVKSQL